MAGAPVDTCLLKVGVRALSVPVKNEHQNLNMQNIKVKAYQRLQ